MTIVAFEKEVSLKSLSLFSKTIVRQYSVVLNLKKPSNIYKWKAGKWLNIYISFYVKGVLESLALFNFLRLRKPQTHRPSNRPSIVRV